MAKETTLSKPEQKPKLYMLYVGNRMSSDGVLCGAWIALPGKPDDKFNNGANITQRLDEKQRELRLWKKPAMKDKCVGGIYEFEGSDKEGAVIVVVSRRRIGYVDTWLNDTDTTGWQAEHEIATMNAARKSKEKAQQAKGHEALYKGMEGWRNAYRNAVGRRNRAAVLAMVIDYITGL